MNNAPQAIKRDNGMNPLRKLLRLAKAQGGEMAKTAYQVEARAASINAVPDMLAVCRAVVAIDTYGKSMPAGFIEARELAESVIAKTQRDSK